MSIAVAIAVFVAIAIAVLVAFIGWQMLVSRRELRALRSDAERLSSGIFGGTLPPPAVEARFSYGYPSFQVTFASRELLARARHAGLTGLFQDRIQERCGAGDSGKYSFDASRAVCFTSKEELEEIARTYGSPYQ